MNAKSAWLGRAFFSLPFLIPAGFSAFGLYSIREGISKQTVYAGPIGYWLGVFLLYSIALTLVVLCSCVWNRLRNGREWVRGLTGLLSSWAITFALYWLWHLFAQTQYAQG
jgi:hypothetical protein